MKTSRGAAIALLSIALCCGCLAPPNIVHPGSTAYQEKRAEKFDPYAEIDTGVPNGGQRPPNFDTPPAEVLRAQPRIP